jgi:hypothetical protein
VLSVVFGPPGLCGALTGPIANLNSWPLSELDAGREMTTVAAATIEAAHKMPTTARPKVSGGLSADPRRTMRSSHVVAKLRRAGDDDGGNRVRPMMGAGVPYALFGRVVSRLQMSCRTEDNAERNGSHRNLFHVVTRRRSDPALRHSARTP